MQLKLLKVAQPAGQNAQDTPGKICPADQPHPSRIFNRGHLQNFSNLHGFQSHGQFPRQPSAALRIIGKCEIWRRAIIHQIKPVSEQKFRRLSRQMRLDFRLYFRRGYRPREVKRPRRDHQPAILHLAQASQARNQGSAPVARPVSNLGLHQSFRALRFKARR